MNKPHKYSDWQPMSVVPEVNGIYQRKATDGEVWYSKFINGIWYYGHKLDIELAKEKDEINNDKSLVDHTWRGIIEE